MKGAPKVMSNYNNSIFLIDGNYVILRNKENSIMSTAVNYQLSIFGKYNVQPNPETITSLMTKINIGEQVFMPNVINSQQIDVISNRITSISNLGFITQNQQYTIAILNERIDINYNKIDETDLSMNDFYTFATKILSVIIDHIDVKSNRLAINIQEVCEVTNLIEQRKKGKNYLKCADYYNDKEFVEWSMRTNSQVEIEIKEKQEGLNVITEISTVNVPTGQKALIVYHIDINTLPQNGDMRFNKDSLATFVNESSPIATRLIEDVERLITSE